MPGEARPAAPVVSSLVPVTGSGIPVPVDLPESAQDLFRRVVDELAPRGLRDVDVEALTLMCHSAWVHTEARRMIQQEGLLVYGPKGPAVNPLIKVARDEAATYLRIAESYGLTFAARLRLGLMQLAGESMLSALSADLDTPGTSFVVKVD